jgi:hypothetical protein
MPDRIQRQRTKGWRMPPNTVSVTRPGRYGNPYTAKQAREAGYKGSYTQIAQMCVDMFRQEMPEFAKAAYQQELRGKNLACWCKIGEPCHADVILEIANGPIIDVKGPSNG